jgi:hypothetical protein
MLNYIITLIHAETVVIGRAINQMFWEIADDAQRTRSRIRTHRELRRLSDLETADYERLGQIGFSLLQDQISVDRTPEISMISTEIEQLRAEYQRQRNVLDAQLAGEALPFSWRRLERWVESGEWVVHAKILPDSSPWCGRSMSAERPAGVCLAIKRGENLRAVTPDTIAAPGDLMIILAPAASVPAWDRWILHGSASTAGQDKDIQSDLSS